MRPFLIGGDPDRGWFLPLYWLALLVVGEGLSAIMGGRFVTLRRLTVIATIAHGALWLLFAGQRWPWVSFGFLAASWAVVHAELLWSARRAGVTGLPDAPHRHLIRSIEPALASAIMSLWLVTLGVILARKTHLLEDWFVPLAACGATLLLAVSLAGHLRLLTERPSTRAETLGAAMLLQTAALLIATVALALAGWMQVVAWLAMGVAGVGGGRWIRSRTLIAFGLIVLAIGAVRLIVWDSWVGGMTAPIDTYYGLVVSRWMILVVLAALAWFMAGVLIAQPDPTRESEPSNQPGPIRPSARTGWASSCGAIGVVLLLVSALNTSADAVAICAAWLGIATIVGICGAFERRLHLTLHAIWALMLTGAIWFPAFFIEGWEHFHDAPFFHRGLVIALLIAGSFFLLRHLARRHFADPNSELLRALRMTCAIAAGVMIFVSTSAEAARLAGMYLESGSTRAAAVSLWWGLFALALLAIGFMRKNSPTRLAGLGLLAVAAVKAVVFDFGPTVSAGWRAVSILVLGVLMLAVGLVYSRLTRRQARDDHPL
ncbi:MAG TPA: DUF2339 domain-containing protein [Phycisphaerales bacterium]|nr:DUF2339 domain-containing protein [Phycisphaerales bacterium]